MTPQQARVVQAEANARAARQRLAGSATAVQARLKPAVLVREARRELVEARGSAIDVSIRNPRAVALGGVGLMVLLLHRPLWRLIRPRGKSG